MNPVHSSTPKFGVPPLQKRRSIHDNVYEPSPINSQRITTAKIGRKVLKRQRVLKRSDPNLIRTLFAQTVLFLLFFVICSYDILYPSHIEIVTIDKLKENYPMADTNFWPYFESGLSDTIQLNRPSVFILTYMSEEIVDGLLNNLSNYISYQLNKGYVEPIEFTSNELNRRYTKDYGAFLNDVQRNLTTRKLLIVRNLEDLNVRVALAFHSICDEYNPLVAQSVIIFTIKTAQKTVPEEVTRALQRNWNALNAETLDPLLARIDKIVLGVY